MMKIRGGPAVFFTSNPDQKFPEKFQIKAHTESISEFNEKMRWASYIFASADYQGYWDFWLRAFPFPNFQNAKNIFSPKSVSHLRIFVHDFNFGVPWREVSIYSWCMLLSPNDARELKSQPMVAEV